MTPDYRRAIANQATDVSQQPHPDFPIAEIALPSTSFTFQQGAKEKNDDSKISWKTDWEPLDPKTHEKWRF